MDARIVSLIGPPRPQPSVGKRRPVVRQVGRDDIDEAGPAQVGGVVVNGRDGKTKDDRAQIVQVRRREGRAHA